MFLDVDGDSLALSPPTLSFTTLCREPVSATAAWCLRRYQPLKLVLKRQGHIPWLRVGELGVEANLAVIGFIEQVVDI